MTTLTFTVFLETRIAFYQARIKELEAQGETIPHKPGKWNDREGEYIILTSRLEEVSYLLEEYHRIQQGFYQERTPTL